MNFFTNWYAYPSLKFAGPAPSVTEPPIAAMEIFSPALAFSRTAFILALFGVFVEQDGCLVKGIGLVAVIICFIGMMIVSIRNDNKVLDSFREQQTEITLDYESILNDLDKNTIKFYEKYK